VQYTQVNACRSALAQQKKIDELAPMFLEKFDVKLKVRMGLHSGPVDAGNMGSLNRFEYQILSVRRSRSQ